MKKYVAGMVVYPPEPLFPEERKNIVYYRLENPSGECFKLQYWHHTWVSDYPIEIGTPCACGREKAIEDK